MCFELPSGFVGWASLGCKTAPSFGNSLKIAVFERCYGAREAMGGRDKGEDALSPLPSCPGRAISPSPISDFWQREVLFCSVGFPCLLNVSTDVCRTEVRCLRKKE